MNATSTPPTFRRRPLPLDRRRPRLRRRLQPRAVAGRGLARGHRPDARAGVTRSTSASSRGACSRSPTASSSGAGSTASWICCTTGGIGVNLATPTAAPPIWLLQAHPEIATVDADGRPDRAGRATRVVAELRDASAAMRCVSSRAIAERYGPTRRCACGTSATRSATRTRAASATRPARRSRSGSLQRYGDVDCR